MAIFPTPWIIIGSKIPTPPKDIIPYLTAVWRVLLIPSLVIKNFTISCMMYLHYFSFSDIAGKGYFVGLGNVEFIAFQNSFYWTPPPLMKFDPSVVFLCIYSTWSVLLPSCERYITIMEISKFLWRYRKETTSPALVVASRTFPCPGFVHFHFPHFH